jgi:GTPase SAR1 family protein
VRLDPAKREVIISLVYCGPPSSGKTTNLKKLQARAQAQTRGRMLTLDSVADKTLFVDLLTLQVTVTGVVVKLRVLSVPGQAEQNPTRKVVLRDADGVAFVADGRQREIDASNDAFANLNDNLRADGLDPEAMPLVLQFNKRDLPDGRGDEELTRLGTRGRPVVLACAARDEGVLRTFFSLLELVFDDLDRRHALQTRHGVVRKDFLEQVGALFGKRYPA